MTDRRTCTPDEVEGLLGYLRFAFGGHTMTDAEADAHRVVLASATPTEGRAAIEALVLVHPSRPSPHDVAQRLRMLRRAEPPQPEPYGEPASPDTAARRLAHCREALANVGARPSRRTHA